MEILPLPSVVYVPSGWYPLPEIKCSTRKEIPETFPSSEVLRISSGAVFGAL